MTNRGFTKLLISLGIWLFIMPINSNSQSLDLDQQGVLISNLKGIEKQENINLEESLVDIKAIDYSSISSIEDKDRIGNLERYGQGVIIDSEGIIVTNKHVVGKAKHIYVVLSGGRLYEAKLIFLSQTDLCLLKIETFFPLKAIPIADSSQIQIGKNVIAIANAGFNPQRIKDGQVIKVFRETIPTRVDLLEMNIPLNPGDSGGPVINDQGYLVGLIMGKKISNPNISYAIASSKIRQEYFDYRNSILK